MRRLPVAAQIYIWGVMAGGVTALSLLSLGVNIAEPRLIRFVFLCALILLVTHTHQIPVSSKINITISTTVVFAAILLMGPALTCWAIALGIGLAYVYLKQKWFKGAFNTAAYVLTAASAGLTYQLTNGGETALLASWRNTLSLCLAAIVYSMLNSSLAAGAVALSEKQDFRDTWVAMVKRAATQYLALILLGVLTAVVYRYVWWASALLVLPLVIVYHSLKTSQELRVKTEEAEALAIEHASLYRGEQRRAKELAALNAVAAAIGASLDLDKVLNAALDTALDVLGFEVGGIGLWDEAQRRLVPKAVRGVSPELLAFFIATPRAGGLRESALGAQEPIFSDDITHDPRVNPQIQKEGFTATAIIPLSSRDRLLGLMGMTTRASRRWTMEEKRLLVAIGHQIGMAIENARLYESVQQELAERKRAEEALRESEEKYRTLMEEAPTGICNVDIKGKFTYVNRTILQDTGYSREELVGKNGFRLGLIPHGTLKLLRRRMKEKLMGQPPSPMEIQFKRKDGTWMWIEIRGRLLREHGVPVGVQIVGEDITERKQAEEALQESEERLQGLFETMTEGIVLIASDGQIVQANPAAERILGLRHSEIEARNYIAPEWEILRPDGAPMPPEEMAGPRAMTEKRPVKDVVMGVKRPDGSISWINVSAAPLINEAGELEGVVGTFADITERKRAEEEVKRRAAQLATLHQASAAVASRLTLDEIFDTVVQGLSEAFGYRLIGIYLIEEGVLELKAQAGYGSPPDPAVAQMPLEKGIVGRTARTGQPQLVTNVEEAPDFFYGAPGITSEACVPLKRGDEVLGVLNVESDRVDKHLDASDLQLLTLLSNHIVVAIENARLFEEERKRAAQLALINEVDEKVASILDLDRLMREVPRSVQEKFGYYNVALFLLNEERREVVRQAVAGGFEHIVPGHYRQSLDEGIIGFVTRTGKSRLANDVSKDSYYVKGFLGEVSTKSELCVPIKLGDEVIGALDVQSIQLNDFDQEDIMAMEAVADRLAIAIQNARLYQETVSLYEVGLAVTSTPELDKTLRAIYEQVNRLMSPDTFYVALYDEARGELSFQTYVEEGEWLPTFTRKLDEGGLTAWIVQSREPLFIGDLEKEGESLPATLFQTGKPGVRSWMGFPLIARDNVVGVISVQSFRPHAFTEGNKRIVSAFANQAAIAIENARLFDETRERAESLSALYQIGKEINATLELDRTLDTICDEAMRATGVAIADVALVDFEQGTWEMKAIRGFTEDLKGVEHSLDVGIHGRVARTGEPAIIPDVSQTEDYLLGDPRVRSELTVPILSEGKVVGVANLESMEPLAFDEDDLRFIQALADQAAIAIKNARLFEAEARRRREAETLRRAALALTTTLDRSQVIERILAQLQQVVPYDSSSVQLLKDDRLEIISGRGFPNTEEVVGISFPVDGDNPNREVMRTLKPLILEDAPTVYEDFKKEPFAQMGIRSWLGVPMLVGDRPVGMIALDKCEPGFYTEEHARLAQAFAAQAAIAIENARLFEETEGLKVFSEGILQGMEEGIMVEDAEGYITFVNPKMAEMLGYTEEELVGKHWSETAAPSCLRQVEEESSKRPKGISSQYEAVLLGKDGKEVPGLVSARPLFREGEFAGTLSVFTDLTEMKEMEQQLIQAGKLVAIGEMVAGVAHELNNPLTTVLGYSELLKAEDLGPEVRADIEKIHRAGQRCQGIVNNLLDFARQRKPATSYVDINPVILSSLALRKDWLGRDNIEVVTELEEGLPRTMADADQLGEVFLNIIINAHQAMMADGEGKLTIRSESQNGETIRVAISDTGPGIPPDIMPKIFDPFFTTREVGKGTGLGLSVSYGIVQQHGGRIWAESEVGKGATFFVELPIRDNITPPTQ